MEGSVSSELDGGPSDCAGSKQPAFSAVCALSHESGTELGMELERVDTVTYGAMPSSRPLGKDCEHCGEKQQSDYD
jgi:hypothetical protein